MGLVPGRGHVWLQLLVQERCRHTLVLLCPGQDSSEEQEGLGDVLCSCSHPGRDQLRRDTALCEDRLLGELPGPQASCAAAAFELNSFRQGALERSKGRAEGRVEGERLSARAPVADLPVGAGPSCHHGTSGFQGCMIRTCFAAAPGAMLHQLDKEAGQVMGVQHPCQRTQGQAGDMTERVKWHSQTNARIDTNVP